MATLSKHSTCKECCPPANRSITSTAHIAMGSCQFKGKNGFRCRCSYRESTQLFGGRVGSGTCDNCSHPMDLHQSYDSTNLSSQLHMPADRYPADISALSLLKEPFGIPHVVAPREHLVNGIIKQAEDFRLILVRGTPACGKTTLMHLVANWLFNQSTEKRPVYVMTGWDKEDVYKAGGWKPYLEQKTGIGGNTWPVARAYLLLDEAQESYWDTTLWSEFFKSIIPFQNPESPYVILFASYGSPGRGYAGFYESKYFKMPMELGPQQVLSMRPEESFTTDSKPADSNGQNCFSLLLGEEEAVDVMKRSNCSLPLSSELMEELFSISDGHVGCLAALVGLLDRAKELDHHRRHADKFELGIFRERILNNPKVLFCYLRNTPFTRGMPQDDILQNQSVAKIFKRTVACGEISEGDFTGNELQILEMIWRNGWLHAKKTLGTVGSIHYVFPSSIHRWYCSYLLRENRSEDPIHYSAPLDLVIDAIRSMNPRHLSDPPRSLSRESLPLEDQYQKEFYRSFYTLVDGNVVISPEYVVKTGKGGGTIDFLLPSEKWGIELLRNRNKVVEHMERFTASGAYHAMIDSDVMKHYIVLDFSTSMPQKSRPACPEYYGHLYHVVFSERYRHVNIIDAKLTSIKSLALLEHPNPLA